MNECSKKDEESKGKVMGKKQKEEGCLLLARDSDRFGLLSNFCCRAFDSKSHSLLEKERKSKPDDQHPFFSLTVIVSYVIAFTLVLSFLQTLEKSCDIHCCVELLASSQETMESLEHEEDAREHDSCKGETVFSTHF